jgi:hypothetical protein
MVASPGSAPDVESVRAAIVIIAVCIAVFWKELLRLLLALIVIALGVGVFMLLHSMHG